MKDRRAPTNQSYGPTSGSVSGVLGLLLLAVASVFVLTHDQSRATVRIVVVLALVGVLIWAFLLRPRVIVQDEVVVLRNALSDLHIPLARIDVVKMRAVTVVEVGGAAYIGVGVGYPPRKMNQAHPPSSTSHNGSISNAAFPGFVQERVLEASSIAKQGPPPEQQEVRRVWARAELVVVGVLLVVFLALLL